MGFGVFFFTCFAVESIQKGKKLTRHLATFWSAMKYNNK